MRGTTKLGVLGLGLALALGACGGDDNGPDGGGLNDLEKQALANALAQSDTVTGLGGFAAGIVQVVEEVGRLNAAARTTLRRAVDDAVRMSVSGVAATSYDGVGFAIEYDYIFGGETYSGYFIGVVGWSGINTSTNTVDELVMVGGFGEGSMPSSASGSIEDGDVFSVYWDGATGYYGISGSASASSSFSGSSTDCSAPVQGYTFECTYTTGSITGNFDFVASDGDGGSYTQSPIGFSGLPALRMSITITD